MIFKRKLSEPTRLKLYRRIWRWHFYAGVFCIPFILTLAISGGIYLFKPQIESWLDQSYQNLPFKGEAASAEAQIQAALKAVPGAQFIAYQLPAQAGDAVKITLSKQGQRLLVYLHPQNLFVLKTIPFEEQFIRQVREFHGELMAGKVGSILVEVAACWAVVLIVSGLYLWWPKNTKGLAGVMYPRLFSGKRLFWRDIHAVTGVWISALVLFLLISGLPWALLWGSAFKELRSWGQPPAAQDWSLRAEHHHQPESLKSRPVLQQTVIDTAVALNFAPPVELSPLKNRPDQWQLKSQSQNRPLRAEATLDATTGKLISQTGFAERGLTDRVIGVAIAAHEGQLFGWFNQLLGLFAVLGLVLLAISGGVMWWRRRPIAVLGAPPLPTESHIAAWVSALVLLLAVLLPAFALSLIALLLIEKTLLRCLPACRQWLGLV
ncbi:putative iron-regulated membrane protein [Spongiibacter sp. IMCC21906]|uniref:PepSY-associated TM helix domain-containing protein n=1 Tax=Spongiibacter sp. IMCC21906 TaxID=1620392 RepID=UPI00062DD522|nr:PepSY domain-containing protein [Spongiibacter sp. IMCC21906]AKH67747.1 putative iron-regulated membrane protein [Spongiibacter sp. IMCC21906]